MKQTSKYLLEIILFILLLMPVSPARSQGFSGLISSYTGEGDKTAETEEKRKKKKGESIDFFALGFDKLSLSFFARLVIDIISVLVLIRLIYYPIYRKKDFFFTFFIFNIVIFIITYLMNKVELSMGAAFGLFAVFSLLRYRTEDISTKDMTYLFVVIALGLISAINKGTVIETTIINIIILVVAYALDANFLMKNENTKKIQYENIELIRVENYQLLLDDLKKRTGLNIHKISIDRIDFLHDTATITIYYYNSNGTNQQIHI